MKPRTYDCGFACPVEAALDVLGGRWKGTLLYQLLDGPKRNSELRRRVRGASPRVLAQQLRELEAAGVVDRSVSDDVPPKVAYALTAFGRSLEPLLLQTRDWGETYLDRIEADLAAAGDALSAAGPASAAPPISQGPQSRPVTSVARVAKR